METLKSNWIYLAAGVGIFVLFYFYKNSTTVNQGSTVLNPDNSAAVGAASQMQQTRVAAGLQGFSAITGLVTAEKQAQAALDAQTATLNAQTRQAQIEADTQRMAAKNATNAQKHHDNVAAIGSIVSTIAMIAMFCYRETERNLHMQVPYLHGVVENEMVPFYG